MPVQEEELNCELWSKEWELNVSESEGGQLVAGVSHSLMYCGKPECALYGLLAMVTIPVTSFIVSGSVVVVGNTVHWLEEQGRCEESLTQEAIDVLLDSTASAGGAVIQTGNEFVRWVKQYSGANSAQERPLDSEH